MRRPVALHVLLLQELDQSATLYDVTHLRFNYSIANYPRTVNDLIAEQSRCYENDILPALAEQTRSTLGQVSILFSARALGYLLGSLLGGRLFDRLPGLSLAGVPRYRDTWHFRGHSMIPVVW